MTEFVFLSTALKTAWKNSNPFKSYDNFSQYANKLKNEKLDVTINSFHPTMQYSVISQGVTEFKQKILIEIP